MRAQRFIALISCNYSHAFVAVVSENVCDTRFACTPISSAVPSAPLKCC